MDLFKKTDTESSIFANTQIHIDGSLEGGPVRKQYVFSFPLAERLRVYAFKTRRKEVDIVRQALEEFLKDKV